MIDWQLPKTDLYFRKILQKSPEGFELDHLDFALQHCKQFRVAVDGGAHIGTWSVALAKRFQLVYAFEPAQDTFNCLALNTKHIYNVVRSRRALGEHDSHCLVKDDILRPGNSGARIVEWDVGFGNNNAQGVALDSYVFEDVDFIKLDVEGGELLALKGATETIARYKPTIMIECKKFDPPRHGGPEQAILFLKELGYKHVGGVNNDWVFVI